jgi:hypothetical protein
MGFHPVAVVLRHTTLKHSTQNYIHNNGHTAHNEYNANYNYN